MATLENDLTQSRILIGKEFKIKFFNRKNSKLRWFKKCDTMIEPSYASTEKAHQLVLTGNSDDRELKRLWVTREKDVCDCCGSEIKRKPYGINTGNLCLYCFTRLEDECSKKDRYGFKLEPPIKSVNIRNDGSIRRIPRKVEIILNESEI